jgi:hypothetical protein
MRRVAPAVLLSVLIAQSALAAPRTALAPGKPAGIKQAQDEDTTPLLVFGAAAVGIGIALAVSDNGTSATPSAPTTTTTTTTGTAP